jgi:hypothetical protein
VIVFSRDSRSLMVHATIEKNEICNNRADGHGGAIAQCDGMIRENIICDNSGDWGGGLSWCDGTVLGNSIFNNTSISGGGLEVCNGPILDNAISGNLAEYGGGLSLCHGTIQNNTIADNSAAHYYGGGLYQCNGIIRNNTISKNSASLRDGGGLYECNGIIQNNTISGNWSAAYGGALYGCNGTVQNNTISANSAEYGGCGLYRCCGFIINCIIWENRGRPDDSQLRYYCSTPFYSCIQEWAGGGIGNISADPKFVSPSTENYHLLPDSPCINAANTYYVFGEYLADIDGECRLAGSAVDMGSDEWGSLPDNDADLLGDSDEATQGTSPDNPDTDGDGLKDGAELLRGTNPSIHDSPEGIFIPTNYPSVQQAIFLAFPLERIVLLPDTYKENLHLLGKNTTLQGIDPLDDDMVSSTTIDGDGLFSVIFFAGSEDEKCAIRGLTIRNGAAQYGGGICGNGTLATVERNKILGNSAHFGGGLYNCCGTIENNSISGNSAGRGGGLYICNGTIKGNIVSNNSSDSRGGGLSCCDGIIANNTIQNNSALDGAGLDSCNGTMEKNTISDNSARSSGGGLIYCNGTIQNNTIYGNGAHYGGGLYGCDGLIQNNIIWGSSARYSGGGLSYCRGIIQNNMISNNSASEYGGGLCWCSGITQNNVISKNWAGTVGGGLYWYEGSIQNNTIWGNSADYRGGGLFVGYGTIRNCIIWQNSSSQDPQLDSYSAPSYCCIQDWTGGGTGNISFDPQLVDPDNGDFHLKPTSPCIDAGCYIPELSFDFEGNPRPWDGASEPRGDGSDYDIGADEFIGSIGFNFTSSQEQWTTGTAVVFSAPQLIFEPGSLRLISQNNTNTFGYWSSTANAIPVTRDYLYRARFVVSTDVSMPELVPEIRLRVNSSNFQQADCLIIDSTGDGGASPTPEGKTYDLYFVPSGNADFCMLAFDLLNFNSYDAARAELALESVLVERFSLDTLDDYTTSILTYDFETSQEFWSPGDGGFVFTNPEFFWDEGALHLRSTTNTNTFGYWHNDPADIIIEPDRLYRGTFDVRTDESERSRVPQMRLRLNTANMQACRTLEIASSGDGANSPGTSSTPYDRLYFLPPANCVGKGLIVSFDILNFSPDDAPEASLILDRATIETFSPPAFP